MFEVTMVVSGFFDAGDPASTQLSVHGWEALLRMRFNEDSRCMTLQPILEVSAHYRLT